MQIKARRVGTRGRQWLLIVEEDPALMIAGTQPRISRRIRLRSTVAAYPLHIYDHIFTLHYWSSVP
jgi:hypothetical protein